MGVDGTGDFCHIRVCSEEDVVFKEKSGGGGGGGEWETQELEQLIAE